MRIAAIALGMLLVAAPAGARGGHRGMFAPHHGHSINAWMGSHRPRLR